MKTRITWLLTVAAIVVRVADAHDFWIEPSTFQPATNELVQLHLRVGEDFQGKPVLRDSARIDRFIVVGPSGEQPVPGRDGMEPAGLVRADAPGMYVIGYRSKPQSIELEPGKFEDYLRMEGFDRIIKLRQERGEHDKPGREIFSRCAKSLLVAGAGHSEGFDRALGFRLEIVPEQNPMAGERDQDIPFQILYGGKPCAGVLVTAFQKGEPSRRLTARSDENGRVLLRLSRGSTWLVATVHMVAAPEKSGADWESLWASLTFNRP